MNKPSPIANEDLYSRQNSHEFMMMTEQLPSGYQLKGDINMESSEDSNDEIQRYMQNRGGTKRHTVGCTDDLSSGQSVEPPMLPAPTSTQGTSSSRQRRTGLLTVMERPPGRRIKCLIVIRFWFFSHEYSFLPLIYLYFLLICRSLYFCCCKTKFIFR